MTIRDTTTPVEALVYAVEAAGDPSDESYEARIIRGLRAFGYTIARLAPATAESAEALRTIASWGDTCVDPTHDGCRIHLIHEARAYLREHSEEGRNR